ncbi:hypothetical protein LTR22_028311 [Elasticomyces elasticus]|nr:hypothetical protein LTR22_028311 [Elasticomyces elasticus]
MMVASTDLAKGALGIECSDVASGTSIMGDYSDTAKDHGTSLSSFRSLMTPSGSSIIHSEATGAMSSGSNAIRAGTSSVYSQLPKFPQRVPLLSILARSFLAIGITLLALVIAALDRFYNTPRNREASQNLAQHNK